MSACLYASRLIVVLLLLLSILICVTTSTLTLARPSTIPMNNSHHPIYSDKLCKIMVWYKLQWYPVGRRRHTVCREYRRVDKLGYLRCCCCHVNSARATTRTHIAALCQRRSHPGIRPPDSALSRLIYPHLINPRWIQLRDQSISLIRN